MPQTQAIDLTAHASELTMPCVRYDECGGSAEWGAWSSHGLECPATGFVCTSCKQDIEFDWARKLRSGTIQCAHCHGVASGNISEHLRFIPL